MMKIRNHFLLVAAGAISLMLANFVVASAQDRRTALGTTTMREPNVPSPNLYADQIKLKVTLTSLPGSDDPSSRWEGSYQIYFVPEADYYAVLEGLPPGGQSLSPSQFAHKRLLSEGTIKKTGLGSLQDRTVWRSDIELRNKVPPKEQTKFGRLLTSYSIKIYDARLRLPLYHAGVFVTYVFEKSPAAPANVSSRQTLFLNFTVTPQGTLSYSQMPNR